MKTQANKITKSSFFVALGTEVDMFRFPQMTTSQKFAQLDKQSELTYYQVDSLASASNLCRQFIESLGLGASNWLGGRVVDEEFNFLAKISYNGSVWDSEDWRNAKEIKV